LLLRVKQGRKLSSGGSGVWTQYSNPALAGSSIDDCQPPDCPPSYKDSLQPSPCRQESSTSNDSYFTCCANNLTPVVSSTLLGTPVGAPTAGGGLSTTWSTVDRDTLQPSPLRQESNASNDSYVTCFSHSRSSPTPPINNGGPSASLDSTLSASGARLAVFATPDYTGSGEPALPPRPSSTLPAKQVPDGALIQQTLRGGLTTTWQRSSPSSRSYDEASRRRLFELYPRPLQITHISFEDIIAPTGCAVDDDGQVSRYRRPTDAEDRGWLPSLAAVRSPETLAPMSATGQALKQAFKTHRQDGRDTPGPRGPCPPPPLPPHPLATGDGPPPDPDAARCPAGSSGCEPTRTPGGAQVSVGNAGKLRRAFFVTGKHPARRLLPEQTSTSNNQSGTSTAHHHHRNHSSALFVAGLADLNKPRDSLSHNFFKSILPSTSCLHNLLPQLAILNYCLALGLPPNILEFLIELKVDYQSFISYARTHYQ